MSKFAELRKLDVSKHVEKKNGLSYLSWAWAVDVLLQNDPAAKWTYSEPQRWGDTVMIFCTVEAFGVSRTAQLPVMDHRNRPIPNPDAFQVNTTMQRVLAKAIALHGIGLYIYAGEDLPEGEEQPKPEEKQSAKSVAQHAWEQLDDETRTSLEEIAKIAREYLEQEDDPGAVDYIDRMGLDADHKAALWSRFDSKERGRLKKAKQFIDSQQKVAA